MPRYRADPPAARVCREAEGMTLLYHRPSGLTHVLLPPAPEILNALDDGMADASLLARRLGVGDDDEAVAVIAARVDELAAIGLVSVMD